MMKWFNIFMLCVTIFFGKVAYAQSDSLIQFSGIVMSSDSLMALPFTTVIRKGFPEGVVSNYRGFFSLVVAPGDEVIFNQLGYDELTFVVPDTMGHHRYSTIQLLTRDTINLAETIVYPWPSKEAFKEAFLSLNIPDDDLERAKRNLDREVLKEMGERLPYDGTELANYYAAEEAYSYYYFNQNPPMNILSPKAWGEFIEAWKRGDFKRKSKTK